MDEVQVMHIPKLIFVFISCNQSNLLYKIWQLPKAVTFFTYWKV
jgi:hypothetical protein